MNDSSEKRILLGLTGGVAAYKAAELLRLLMQEGLDVQIAMTDAAKQFVGSATLQALSGKPVYDDLWDSRIANNMAHIELSRDRDAIVIAPASADFIAKLAHGLADDLLSTLCLARECPLAVVPAMNRSMWENPATQRNIAQLKQDGIAVFGPALGAQACGETGLGRMLEPEDLVYTITAWMQPKILQGRRVLVTAGPTFEAIDTVRGITNLSSGKMGYAVARAAYEAGADVTLISGPTALSALSAIEVTRVTTAQEMLAAVQENVATTDIFISVAAVADYHVAEPSAHKIKKTSNELELTLSQNPDILQTVSELVNPPFCVGFAAESENLYQYAEEKRRRKKLPLLAANLAQDAIGSDDNELILFDDDGSHPLPRASKLTLARQLVKHISKLYPQFLKQHTTIKSS